MTQRVPQLILTLSPEGGLVLELPGTQSTRRQVPVRDGELAQTCHRILQAQMADQVEIGADGAPTVQQVKHWERHQIWADSRCRFCLAEKRATPERPRLARKVLVSRDSSGVEVRRIRAGVTGLGQQSAKKDAGEIGL